MKRCLTAAKNILTFIVFLGQKTTGIPVIADLGSSSACSFKTTWRVTENQENVKENSLLNVALRCVSPFSLLPSCLPAGPVGSLFPPERISYFQGATPASPPASWVRSVQTVSSASICSGAQRTESQRGFGGNLERWCWDCSCPPSQQIKRPWSVGPFGCLEMRVHPGQLSRIFQPGHPGPESSRTSPRSCPGSASQSRGSLRLPSSHCLKGQNQRKRAI